MENCSAINVYFEGKNKRTVLAMSSGEGWPIRLNTEDFWESKMTLYDAVTVDICYYTSVKTHRMYKLRANCSINRGLQMIMLCQRRLIGCNQCRALAQDADDGALHVWGRDMGGLPPSLPPFQFCCEPKTALKNTLLKIVLNQSILNFISFQ